MYLPSCVMCDDYRTKGSVYCSRCKIYEGFENEGWYKEILAMNQKQRRIDRREGLPLLSDHASNNVDVRYKRHSGRSKVFKKEQSDLVWQVYESHNKQLSLRELTRILNAHGLVISRETVRNIINHRKKTPIFIDK